MKKLKGIVVSDKMQKTVTVQVERWTVHPLYKKRLKRHNKYHAQNPIGAKVGDRVVIVETRPLSKTKKWKIVEVVKPSK